ncbi:MAG: branched-chain-amino-acid transaminase [Gammaproteobacteria bacterium]|nr:branched-chain-amino-acid transaminase [Gammaproteobacteria bacterium]
MAKVPAGDMPEYAILNGNLLPFGEARVSIMAPGLTFAAAVFEGIRAYWNDEDEALYLFRMQEHLDRLQFSMRVVEFDDPPASDTIAAQIQEVIKANGMREDCYIRAQVFIDEWGDIAATGPTGSSVIVRRRPRQPGVAAGKHFVVSSWRRIEDDASPARIKATGNYLNSRLVSLEASRQGAGGAIILNRDGTVSEGPSGCVFMVRDATLITPPVTAGILESVTRATLLTLAADLGIDTVERPIGRTELYLASEVFYCGTGQEIVPILSVDKKAVGSGEPGAMTRQLQGVYDAVVHGREQKYMKWLTPAL